MPMSDEYLEGLREQERTFELRLASVRAAINVYTKGEIGGNQPSGCPSLDRMRIRDAIAAYLGFRHSAGLPPATLGELDAELERHNVVNSRNESLRTNKHPWKSLAHTLAAEENADIWQITRRDPDGHFTRLDTIELRVKTKV